MGWDQGIRKLGRLGVVMLGAYVVAGCPSPTASKLLASSGVQRDAIAQESTQSSESETNAIDYNICADVENWQRPSSAVQAKRINEDVRYRDSSQIDALKNASDQFWDHDVVSFTTYGLSARMEPENLSGVWTATEEIASCYTPEDTVAINEGNLAETWLLNQRISSVEWTGDRYVMTVESAPSGLQVVQFDRVDELASLPLDVLNTSGELISVTSGDWQ